MHKILKDAKRIREGNLVLRLILCRLDFVPFEHPAEDPATPLPMVEQLKNEVDSPTDGIDVTNMTHLLSLLHADLKGLIRNPNISSHLSDRNKQIIKIRMNQIKHCLDVNVQ